MYHEPVHGGFFRARPETHMIISRLSPDQTLGQVWEQVVADSPSSAPGQEEFFDLVSSLYKANLLFVEGPVSETRLLDRSLKKKKKPIAARVSELFFLKVPLWYPDPFLTRNLPIIDRVFSTPILILFIILTCMAGYVFIGESDRAFDQTGSILEPSNILFLFLATFITHIFHEMAHAALCRYYGGSVRAMGVMFLIFTPLPYADVTSSWQLRNQWHRAAIGAAGMASDMVFCSLATVYWVYSPPGLSNSLALNIMFTTLIYTFVFNVNPLMRFDGYYILSDLIGVPNLHQRSKESFDAFWRKIVLSEPEKKREEASLRRKLFLNVFFVTSFVYRTAVSLGIVLFLADQYFGLGLIGAAAIAYNTFGKPAVQAGKTLMNPYFRSRNRKPLRFIGLGACITALFFAFFPIPEYRILEGVVEADTKSQLYTPVEGKIVDLPVAGMAVGAGDVLFLMSNPELDAEKRELEAKLLNVRLRAAQAVSDGGQGLAALEREMSSLQARIEDIDQRQAALVIVASQSGVWSPPEKEAPARGQWVARGHRLGEVVAFDQLRFRGMLTQEVAYGLSSLTVEKVSVRATGDVGTEREVSSLVILPYSSKDLPSVALTPLSGGTTAVAQSDTGDLAAIERFFLIDAMLVPSREGKMVDGRTAWMRMQLPHRPLLSQWLDRLSQFLQQRYKL